MIYFLPACVILMLVIAFIAGQASVELKKKEEYICELVAQNAALQYQLDSNHNNTEEQTNENH